MPDSSGPARLATLARLAVPTSHDIRGACGAMAIHVELLATVLRDLPDAAQGTLSDHAAVLERDIRRLLDMVQAFFALVALPDEVDSEFDLGALLEETVAALQPLARRGRVVVELERPSYPVVTTAAREGTRQAVLDLILPILAKLPTGGQVSLRLTPVDGGATLAVLKDDGTPPVVLPLPGRGRE